jgi:type II secretory pathway component PulF
MLLTRQLPLRDLIELCRALRHNLGAGLSLLDVFRQQARRGSPRMRPIADRITDQLQAGESLEDALSHEHGAFPHLFVALAQVGEKTGNLPEIFGDLEKYYSLQQRLWRQFVTQITWPVLQLFAAIFVIAGMLFLLGVLSSPGTKPLDPLGLGTGPEGAILWLMVAFGGLGTLLAVYLVLTQLLKQKHLVDGFLLRLPAVGPCLMALAMTRFCIALRLTMETALSIKNALRLCFRATGNAAFESRAPIAIESVKGGEPLTVALERTRLFPEEFLRAVEAAEEGGRVPEAMRHQVEYYEEESQRKMKTLTSVAGFGVWLMVAGLIIFMIFKIITVAYLGPLNEALKMVE